MGSLIWDENGKFRYYLRDDGKTLGCYNPYYVIESLHEALLNNLGVDVHIWRRKTDGVVCSCYNSDTGEVDKYCEVCYGTGWVGGYDKVEYNGSDIIKMRIQDFSRNIEVNEGGFSFNINAKANLGAEPVVKNRDLVFWISRGLFFEINNYTPKFLKEEITRQEFSLKFLMGNYLIYKLEGY